MEYLFVNYYDKQELIRYIVKKKHKLILHFIQNCEALYI